MTLASHSQDRNHSPRRIDWDGVWQCHARWLRTVIASRLGENDAIDDVLQQVGLAAVQSSVPPLNPDLVAPWLYRIAVRQCLMFRRGAGRRRRLIAEARIIRENDPGDGSSEPLDWLMREERASSAVQAMGQLPELDRQLLWLRHTEDWTYRQLAEHLGVTEHVVEYRLLQARKRLRSALSRAGVVEEISS